MKKVTLAVFLFVGSFIFSCTSSDDSQMILDVPNLVQKLPEEVVGVLGEPDTVYYDQVFNKKFLVQRYKEHDLEIQYLNGKSNDIILNDASLIEFKQESLNRFGIKPAIPTVFRDKEMIKWKNHSGLKTINFYNVKLDSVGNIINFTIFFKG